MHSCQTGVPPRDYLAISTLSSGSEVAISQRVRVGGAVIGGVRISHATRRRYRCCIGDRSTRRGADGAGSFVGNRTRRWHGHGVVDIAAAVGTEPGSAATLGGGIGDTGEVAWEDIVNDYAANFTRPTFVTTIV